jgi:hypothetical protein
MSGISVTDWLAESADRVRRKGVRGLLQSAYYAYAGALLSVTTRYPLGTNVFERDWDLLVVLDACRVDALREVADEYDFLPPVESIRSVGSTSIEWMALTFRERYAAEISKTAYVNGNAQFDKVFRERRTPPHIAAAPFGPSMDAYGVVDPADFAAVDAVYEYGFDDDHGVVLPRTMTDRAVAAGREEAPDRCIVHYMQPHEPYLGVEDPPEGVFAALRDGSLTRAEAWEMYVETLRTVLDDVALLLENYDADRVAITADHGEAFGEWTFYSHNVACPHPAVRRVPWVETTATDEGTYEPSVEPTRNVSADVEDQLAKLGYR